MNSDIRDFLANLITKDRWSGMVLGKLCSLPHGSWATVSSLCHGLPDATEQYEELIKGFDSEIVAVWLPHPFQPDDAVLVIFYQDDELATKVAIVTQTYLKIVAPTTSI